MYERNFRGLIIVLVREVPQKTGGFRSGPRVIHARAKLLKSGLRVHPILKFVFLASSVFQIVRSAGTLRHGRVHKNPA
jgi:hypothetical protein